MCFSVCDLSLGDGGQARLFAELGVRVRLGARLALRVMAARARVLALLPGTRLSLLSWLQLVLSRLARATWLEHAASVMHDFGVEPGVLHLKPAEMQSNSGSGLCCTQQWPNRSFIGFRSTLRGFPAKSLGA